jgi:capsid protein
MSYTVKDRRCVILDQAGNPIFNEAGTGNQESGTSLVPVSAYGSFQGANYSNDRGYVYLPTLDTKREVDAWSRIELMRRARFVYNSGGGLPHRLVDGYARMVCGTGLLPHPTPTKKTGRVDKLREWSRNVRTLYMERQGSANTFDISRRRNVFQGQRATMRCKIKDGDSAKVLVRDMSTGRLRCKFYEANQIGSGIFPLQDTTGFFDGVATDANDAPTMFRFVGIDTLGLQAQVDVPAQNVLFSLNDERIGQVRGLTRFYPVLNKILDLGEIRAAITKGIKVSAQVAYVIEQQLTNQQAQVQGASGSLVPRPTTVIETNDGKQVTMDKFLAGGEAWGLKPGQQFKIVQSTNPSQNVAGYMADMIRDICYAIGCNPEIGWNIIDAGGANMRFIQADMGQQIEVEQDDLIDQDLGPGYVAWLYDMIVAGEVEEVDGWEKHVWIAPARLTVDFGRDGKLYIEEYKRGIRSMKSMYGMRGEEWSIELAQYLDERQELVQGVYDRSITTPDGDRPMTMAEAFPEIGVQNAFASVAADPSAADTPEQLNSMQTQLTEIHHAITFARETK